MNTATRVLAAAVLAAVALVPAAGPASAAPGKAKSSVSQSDKAAAKKAEAARKAAAKKAAAKKAEAARKAAEARAKFVFPGTVVSSDTATATITLTRKERGQPVTRVFFLAPSAKVVLDGAVVALGDIKPGDKAVVHGTRRDGRLVVWSVKAERPAPAPATEPAPAPATEPAPVTAPAPTDPVIII